MYFLSICILFPINTIKYHFTLEIYRNICELQNNFVTILRLNDIDNVTIEIIKKHFEYVNDMNYCMKTWYYNTLLPILNDLEFIHNTQNMLFITTNDVLHNDEESYDKTFITMSNHDIKEYNNTLQNKISQIKETYNSEIENKSSITPNMQWRVDPPLHIGC